MIAQVKPVFLYMYPQKDILDFEVKNHSWRYECPEIQMEFEARFRDTSDEFEIDRLRQEYFQKISRLFKGVYSETLNHAIDLRYRQKGFRIFYALLDDSESSDVIDVQPADQVIYVGMDARTHRTPDKEGRYTYPDRDYILDQLGNIQRLVVSGFHLNDCVKKISRRAYVRGMDVLVDEELTELFGHNILRKDFDPSKYPSVDPHNIITSPEMFEYFLHRRRGKPWLYDWEQ